MSDADLFQPAEEGEIWPDDFTSGSSSTAGAKFEFLDTSLETVHFCYGFKPDALAASRCSTDLTVVAVSRFLGDPEWISEKTVVDPTQSSSRDIKGDVRAFFEYLLRAETLEDVPEELYDLREQNSDVLRPSPIQLHWEDLDGTTVYLFTHKSSMPDQKLDSIAVRSAASALEILRRDWVTLEQVAMNLVARGIAFQTLIRGIPPISPAIRDLAHSYRGLGYRPHNFQPRAEEYAGYEEVRNQILFSGRGRAALMMGGVIARLARDVISSQSVCCGPTKNVRVDGQCVWDGQPSSPAYWDDALTAKEVDVICGVYEVATGPSQGNQTKWMSWWPTPSAWETSGLNNPGHRWTPACEIWFQRRLAQIQFEKAYLLSHTQWKRCLEFERRCAPIAHINERLAKAFLTGHSTRVPKPTYTPQSPPTIRNENPHQAVLSNTNRFALQTWDPKPIPINPAVQQATRQYWNGRREFSQLFPRTRLIERRLRTLGAHNPDDIYLSSSDLDQRLAAVQAELAEERSRVREVESIAEDIRRECTKAAVIPLLEALIQVV